nr:GNAT family N-acetyltransferase [Thioalkalivibrio sp.]
MSQELVVRRHTGSDLVRYLAELAQLRIRVFRDFPYLYEGDLDYERRYLETYTRSPRSVVVLVFDGADIVGASTGLPLSDETPNVIAPFVEQGYDPAEIFYFGESVLLPQYRGRGLGVRFFEEREAHARGLGGFCWTAFCAVDRPLDHPRRPPDHLPLDRFWEKRGYCREPSLKAVFSWRDLDDDAETAKPMTFWMKRLETPG